MEIFLPGYHVVWRYHHLVIWICHHPGIYRRLHLLEIASSRDCILWRHHHLEISLLALSETSLLAISLSGDIIICGYHLLRYRRLRCHHLDMSPVQDSYTASFQCLHLLRWRQISSLLISGGITAHHQELSRRVILCTYRDIILWRHHHPDRSSSGDISCRVHHLKIASFGSN